MVLEISENKKGFLTDTSDKNTLLKQSFNDNLKSEQQKLQILPILIIFLNGKYGKRESYRIFSKEPWGNVSRPTYFKRINRLLELGFLENESNGKGKDALCLSEKAIEFLLSYRTYFEEFMPEIIELLTASPLYCQYFKEK